MTYTVDRFYRTSGGKKRRVRVALCICSQRGPLGGVCVSCHGAITSIDEQREINNKVWEQWMRDNPDRIRQSSTVEKQRD